MRRKRRSRPGRAVDGILLLDKPQGLSSNDALQETKRLFGAAKAGHTGSLDPLATGVLPLCFGEATKFSQFLLNSDKGYWAELKLGVRTDSSDADGEVVEVRPVPALTLEQVDAALEAFRGEIEQVPSMFSAIKRQGQPLYKLARQGLEVEREARPVTIHENRILEFEGDRLVLQILCSKGTYVRTIADDLGEMLGCGAHVTALRRTSVGPFGIGDAHTIAELEAVRSEGGHAALDRLLKPVETAVEHWPEVHLTDMSAYYLAKGQPVIVPRAPTEGWVRIHEDVDGGSRFLGVGEVLDDGRIAPRRLVV
ncbi:MAG: tRNA pseudouridine(55) synthase TruB [Pseudomonadales bacterium]|nr:tRNA pseudouridine(55) synthase TruB [Pseudomonadales bacterium]